MTAQDAPRTTPAAAPGQRSAPPPGGTWTIDASHIPVPLCAFTADAVTEPFARGFAEGFARYGALLETLATAVVRGFLYHQVRPLGAPPDAAGPPPREVWDGVVSQLPVVQERFAAAERALATRLWRADLQRWDDEVKPALAAHRAALRAVDPASLDDAALADHVDACRDALVEGVFAHHRHNLPALLPVGLFLLTALPTTGRTPAELLGLLQGASPVSLGFPAELERLRAALAADDGAAALVEGGTDAGSVLAALRDRGGEVGAAAAEYLDLACEISVDGEDSVAVPGGADIPSVVLARLRAALAGRSGADGGRPAAVQQAEAEVRAALPADQRERFDEALAEARLVYRLRDERSVYGDKLAGALCRRALFEVGRRLADRGTVLDPENALDATAAEVRSLLLGLAGAPSGAELAARTTWRRTATYRDVPAVFGPPPGPPLPAEWLPPAAARVHAATGMVIDAVLQQPPARTTGSTVTGLPVSPGVHEGRAVVVRGPDDLRRVEAGDVLVATTTGPAFNLVLPLVGALVTDRGGLLSHAAIVAREFGVPAVVGCSDATVVVRDGDRVRVDGAAGVVAVL